MANQFNSVNVRIPSKHKFRGLSYTHKFTCNEGELIPVYVQDVLPNDTFKLSVQDLIRFAPLIAPAMTEINVYFHFFFVPNRLIWSQWENFITESRNGYSLPQDQIPQKPVYRFNSSEFMAQTSTDLPTSSGGSLRPGSLADYLGFQTFEGSPQSVNSSMTYDLDAMPFRVYNLIWSQYYRDENLSEDPWFNPQGQDWFADDSGVISGTRSRDERMEFTQIRLRAWKKDYFTSALPFAQKGDDVLIPGTSSGITGTGTVDVYGQLRGLGSSGTWPNNGTNFVSGYNENTLGQINVGGQSVLMNKNRDALHVDVSDIAENLSSGVSEGTIRELRRAMAAQRFLERLAVGGSRYQEMNLSFFGIRGSDARLQRAEFLGGVKHHVMISQLLQTSETTSESPLGTPAGNAVSAGGGFVFKRTFPEHGFIMGIMSVIPNASYCDGIPKMYLRKDRYDYYWPQFAQIGEQPIENQELYFSPIYGSTENANNLNPGTFGYTPRYADYRFRNDTVSGDFKTSLNFWTQVRRFSTTPSLNQSFIECRPSQDIYAVTDEDVDKLWCEVHFDVSAIRPVVKNVNPLL